MIESDHASVDGVMRQWQRNKEWDFVHEQGSSNIYETVESGEIQYYGEDIFRESPLENCAMRKHFYFLF